MSGWVTGGSVQENRVGSHVVGTVDLGGLFDEDLARDIYNQLVSPDPLYAFEVRVTSMAAPDAVFSVTFTPIEDAFDPGATATVRADTAFDHETLPSVDLQFELVTAALQNPDDVPEFFTAGTGTRTLAVVDMPEPPTGLSLTGGVVVESAATGTVVGTLVAEDATPGPYTYTLVSGEGFQIVGNQLRVAAGGTLDFETAPARDVVVDVRNGAGMTARFTVGVEVQDAPEAPSGLALSAATVVENAEAGTLVAELAGTDPEGGALTYTLVQGEGLQIVENQLLVADGAQLDFEAASSIPVRIRVTDAEGLARVFDRTITIGDVQENPTDLVLDGPPLSETVQAGELVGFLQAVDPLGGELTFSIPAGRGFYLDGNGLYVDNGAAFDFETAPFVTLPVTVTTSSGNSTVFQQPIAIADVQENPVDLTLDGGTVFENAEAGTFVAILGAMDPLGGEVTFSVPVDSGFYIDSGLLYVGNGARLDFEAGASIPLSITATSSFGHSTVFQRSITIEDVAEQPQNLVLDGSTLAENAEAGSIVGFLYAEDPLGGEVTFSVPADSAFVVDGNMLLLAPGRQLDHETQPEISLAITARTVVGGYTTVFERSITIDNVPEAPVGLSLGDASVLEDAAAGTIVATLVASDPDNTDFVFGLVAGDGFAIEGNQLVVADSTLFDFETMPEVTVVIAVADADGNVSEFTRTVAIRDAAENPTDIGIAGATVAENAVAGTIVGTLSAADPQGGPFSYSTPDDSRFAVDGNNLVLVLGGTLDFETRPSESVTVTVSDSQGHTATFTRSIAVTDANDAPVVSPWLGNPVVRIAESAPAGREVARVTVADADVGATHTLSLLGPDAGSFVLDGDRVRLAQGATLDADAQPTLTFGVRATDNGNLADAVFLSVRIIEEAPSMEGLGAALGQAGVFAGLTVERTPDGARLMSGSVEVMLPENGMLRLLDGTISVGTETPLAALERLYFGGLGRAADGEGRMVYLDHIENGLSLSDIAWNMLRSDEFNSWVASRTNGQAPGELSNGEFVEILYQRVLGRASDTEGHAFWTGGLDAGGISREDLLVYFTQSPEARELFADETQVLWALDLDANLIRSFYDVTFDRDPDIEGLTFWMNALEDGLTVPQMAQFFVNSDEFQAIITSRPTAQAVAELYRQGLEREPDAEGLAFWAGHIDHGTGQWADILAGFVTSPEQYEQMRAYRDGEELFGQG